MKLWIFGTIKYWRPAWTTKRGWLFFWQKLTRGFTDRDIWALDWTIAKFVLPRLKSLQGYGHGSREWRVMLDKMVWSMEQIAKSHGGDFIHPDDLSPEEVSKYYAKLQEGLTLFGKNFRSLWV